MDMTNLLLLLFLALGIVGNNPSISISVTVLLFLRLIHFDRAFGYLEQYGLQVGIIILTIGVMAPVASGKISPDTIVKTLTDWKALLAVAIGLFVAFLGGRGAHLLTANPLMVTGLLVGTILGVTFFRGVPVGPLIAAGMLGFILQFLPK
jgi:uncharacterized membrane protein (DUF441 family)